MVQERHNAHHGAEKLNTWGWRGMCGGGVAFLASLVHGAIVPCPLLVIVTQSLEQSLRVLMPILGVDIVIVRELGPQNHGCDEGHELVESRKE